MRVQNLNDAIAALGGEFQTTYVATPLFFSLVNETYGPIRVSNDPTRRLRDRAVGDIHGYDSKDAFVTCAHRAWLAQALYRISEQYDDEDQLLVGLFGEGHPASAAPLLREARSAMEEDRAFRDRGED
ncbi:MAG: hypothetical protein JXA67_04550 [Micromonosporaceae bacterium]|nr:hypothetical protein [Micromonosporaceae bacterium]